MTETEKRSYAELAALIAGAGRPVEDKVIHGLVTGAASIRYAIGKAEEQPSRTALRAQLKTALAAAKFLQHQLADGTFERALARSGDVDFEGDHDAHHGLKSLIRRLEKALPLIPKGSSPHKYDPGTNSPQEVCALFVVFAWRAARGSLPPHTSLDPQKACEWLYGLAGGKHKSWGNKLTGWKVHLQQAKGELERENHLTLQRLFNPPAP